MEGTISSYASDMELGIIMAANGKRYVFSKADWREDAIPPQSGMTVVFEPSRSCAQQVRIAGPPC